MYAYTLHYFYYICDYTPIIITFIVVSNKNPDILRLMSKLRQIPGLIYHPEEGRVEVTATTQEERDKCISIFQQAYQQIVS